MRDDQIAEPLPPRPRRHALHGVRQVVPVLHAPAVPEHVDDDAAEFCAVESPTVARAIGVEAYRRHVDAMALDPAHGIAQADGMRDARRRRAKQIAAVVLRDLDGRAEPRLAVSLVLDALERDGVL